MKNKIIILVLLILMIVFSFLLNEKKKIYETEVLLLPSLPRPIANEYALITSAGQSSDVYIVYDAANKLMIHNYFMPKADEKDLEAVNTLVLVAGYSSIGGKFHDINYNDEKNRVINLIKKAKESNKKIITVYIGGMERRNKETEELLDLICKETDYIISTKASDKDKYISKLAKMNKIPLTLVNEVGDIMEPFVSAFR